MSTEAFNVFNNKRLGILLKSQDFPIYHNNFDLNIDNSVDIDLLKNNLDIRLLSNINNLSSPSYLLLDVEREETPAFSVHFNDSNQLDKTPDFNEAIENYNLREPFITSNQLHPQSPLENNVLVPVTLFPSRPVMTPTEMLNFQLPTKIPSIASNVNIKKTTSPRNASLLQEPILKSTKNQHNFIPRPHNLTPEPNMVLKKKLSPQSQILNNSKNSYLHNEILKRYKNAFNTKNSSSKLPSSKITFHHLCNQPSKQDKLSFRYEPLDTCEEESIVTNLNFSLEEQRNSILIEESHTFRTNPLNNLADESAETNLDNNLNNTISVIIETTSDSQVN